MFWSTCIMISGVDLARYGSFVLKIWISGDGDTISIYCLAKSSALISSYACAWSSVACAVVLSLCRFLIRLRNSIF